MKTLLVPIEVTDAQYLALERVSPKNEAYDEAQLYASAAVQARADQVLDEIERMTRDMHKTDLLLLESEKLTAETARLKKEAEEAVAEMKEITDDNMPRQGGFIGKETADAEYLDLQENAGKLTAAKGVNQGPSGKETWYNLPMDGVIEIMRGRGFSEDLYPYWVREDGVKMFGAYVMVAADTNALPKGTTLDTSLGVAIICDHCPAGNIDIAVTWGGT